MYFIFFLFSFESVVYYAARIVANNNRRHVFRRLPWIRVFFGLAERLNSGYLKVDKLGKILSHVFLKADKPGNIVS